MKGVWKMDESTKIIINPEENEIRLKIEELKKQLPRKTMKRKKLPDYPTYEEFNKLIIEAKKRKEKKEYLLCLVLAFEAGMRISEIVGLKNKDGTWKVPPLSQDNINLQGHTIKIVSGKGSKDRVVPLPRDFNERALAMIPIRKSRRSIQGWTTSITQDVLGKRLSIHKFRHGFGTRLANQNVPINQIQMWMGHSRLDTTAVYLHAAPTQENIERVRDLF